MSSGLFLGGFIGFLLIVFGAIFAALGFIVGLFFMGSFGWGFGSLIIGLAIAFGGRAMTRMA